MRSVKRSLTALGQTAPPVRPIRTDAISAFPTGTVGQRRDRCGNPAHDRDVKGFDHLPIGADRLAVAQAVGRGKDHVAAGRQHRKTGRHGAAHVKEREAVDHDVVLGQAVHLREAPGRVNLIAVRQAHELGTPGRAAGMEERADGVPATPAARTPARRRRARRPPRRIRSSIRWRRPACPAPRSSSMTASAR